MLEAGTATYNNSRFQVMLSCLCCEIVLSAGMEFHVGMQNVATFTDWAMVRAAERSATLQLLQKISLMRDTSYGPCCIVFHCYRLSDLHGVRTYGAALGLR